MESTLANLRTRLLDLSARNRLLNFPSGHKGCLRVVGQIPDQFFKILMDGKEFRFAPVPEPTPDQLREAGYRIEGDIANESLNSRQIPLVNFGNATNTDDGIGLNKPADKKKNRPTAKEWAEKIGLATDFELPNRTAGKGESGFFIQTLHYREELDALVRSLHQKAKTIIEETGNNLLFLAFGFLDWRDNDASSSVKSAPLLLMPVNLQRGALDRKSGMYEYRLHFSGEDVEINLSLQEKLRRDFGFVLPTFEEDNNPEQYFRDLAAIIEHKSGWQIHRFITLAPLNSSKLSLYMDLDPDRWPDNGLMQHALVSRFLQGSSGSGGASISFAAEHPVDDLADTHNKYPLVFDADSSQHSALVDAAHGRNMVIEGPPGTGKSQTIANIIAAALVNGKTVLFVAEKLAALEVVQRRLEQIGLGIFCLELHSHQSQKTEVIHSIKRRLDFQPVAPENLDSLVILYERARKDLSNHAALINTEYRQTGLTRHNILSGAVRYRNDLNIDPDELDVQFDLNKITPLAIRSDEETLNAYRLEFDSLLIDCPTGISQHPWYGVGLIEAQNIMQLPKGLADWQTTLASLTSAIQQLSETLDVSVTTRLSVAQKWIKDINYLPFINNEHLLNALPLLIDNKLQHFSEHLELHQQIQADYAMLQQVFNAETLISLDKISSALSPAKDLLASGLDKQLTLKALRGYCDQLGENIQLLEKLRPELTEAMNRLGPHFTATYLGLRDFYFATTSIAKLKTSDLQLRGSYLDNEECDDVLLESIEQSEILFEMLEELKTQFDLKKLPPVAELRQWQQVLNKAGRWRWLSGRWRSSRHALLNLTVVEMQWQKLLKALDQLIDYIDARESFENNSRYRLVLKDHFLGLETDFKALSSLRAWYKNVRQHFGVGFGPTVQVGDALLNIDITTAQGLMNLAKQGKIHSLANVLKVLKTLYSVFGAALISPQNPLVWSVDGAPAQLHQMLSQCLAALEQNLVTDEISLGALDTQSQQANQLCNRLATWHSSDLNDVVFSGQLGLSVGPEAIHASTAVEPHRLLQLAHYLQSPAFSEEIRTAIYQHPEIATLRNLAIATTAVISAKENVENAQATFSELASLNVEEWFLNVDTDDIDEQQVRLARAKEKPHALAGWLAYLRAQQKVAAIGLEGIATAVVGKRFSHEHLISAYRLVLYHALARTILADNPELARFSGPTQEARRVDFRNYSNEIKKLQSLRIAHALCQRTIPPGNNATLVRERTGLALLQHQVTLQRRHLPIRQLLSRASDAIQALKPCFMMGPLSAAHYLDPRNISFDLVIMDEASQMKPEDALGVIARGKQVIIVGDPKQLPPTDFFRQTMGDNSTDADDASVMTDMESILDAALPLFQPVRRLRWHYRSQHESLIAFSNRAFYDSHLIVFPAPHADRNQLGLKFERVADGCFIERRNKAEALKIAERVIEHIQHRPEESIGVVAMNAEQRDFIERAIEHRLKDDPLAFIAMEHQNEGKEPLFVKNLENVQGDERDVIIISMTYGPQQPGERVPQRFGPINGATGWRRLNVLFTRARRSMVVMSSMGSADIFVTPTSSRGVQALRDFLVYAETGRLEQINETGRQPDSDFEIAVARALQQHGYDCQPQVGVAGYYIDIAVRDPMQPGRYLLGVECDGAAYHSSRSARDRDILRQQILESKGWRIHRIWSTDWFKDSESEIRRVLAVLQQQRTQVIAEVAN